MPDQQPEKKRGPTRIRPYALTAGRTEPDIELPIEAVIDTMPHTSHVDWPSGDVRAEIVARCSTQRLSVAEIAAHLKRPLGVIRVIIGDLVMAGYLRVNATLGADATVADRRALLERTLRGLQAL
ncbi:DUF742 domain-containing protein [Skermania piniformis]|uniref:DUF742 domain-containing protein n=1 Tax=Skermania pinensis TaxID=39122 RepID=A0ABX8S7C0_9ACTN|nr:DUF742 domain-containing protein [Skermania piniformis]QXQ13717.1 DUF742 domain-containing protein [Skermania piniformis]